MKISNLYKNIFKVINGDNNCIKLPYGFLVQWGSFAVTVANGSPYKDTTVTFSSPFINATYLPYLSAISTSTLSSGSNVMQPVIASRAANQIIVRTWRMVPSGGNEASGTITWIAIGKWK